MQYNKWVSGQAAREFSSQRMKFKDLVSQNFDTDQSPNNAKANNVLPYQLINAANILSELITNTSSSINAFNNALESPVVRKDEKMTKEVKQMIEHLNDSLNCLRKIIKVVGDGAEEEEPTGDE